jgi:murein DD-endopeptidase MepM/ murein hydrolase activator NlpD
MVVPIRPPDWQWDWPSDGALALAPRLNVEEPFATVPAMSVPAPRRRERAVVQRAAAQRPTARHRRRHLERERRLRRLAVLVAVSLVALVVLLLSAFGGPDAAVQAPVPASAARLLPAGPPAPRIVARLGSLHLQLPISQSRVTAIGYQAGTDGALSLTPVGTQANEGVLKRIVHSVFGGSSVGPRWYQLPGGQSSLDVGAPAGTDVYSPVDGTVLAIDDVVLAGRTVGSRIDIQPVGSPSLVVSVSHVNADPALVVGSPLSAAATRLGSVVDYSHVEHQALARYTNDSGNHVAIEIHASATLGLD